MSSSSSSCSEEAITDIPDIIVDPVEDREVGPEEKNNPYLKWSNIGWDGCRHD